MNQLPTKEEFERELNKTWNSGRTFGQRETRRFFTRSFRQALEIAKRHEDRCIETEEQREGIAV